MVLFPTIGGIHHRPRLTMKKQIQNWYANKLQNHCLEKVILIAKQLYDVGLFDRFVVQRVWGT